MKKTRKRFVAILILLASIICLKQDLKYMESVLWYADLRDTMKYANELAAQVGWTEHVSDMYREAEEYIRETDDPVIILIRTHTLGMKFYTLFVICRMALCVFGVMLMARFMQLEILSYIRRKKRKLKKK